MFDKPTPGLLHSSSTDPYILLSQPFSESRDVTNNFDAATPKRDTCMQDSDDAATPTLREIVLLKPFSSCIDAIDVDSQLPSSDAVKSLLASTGDALMSKLPTDTPERYTQQAWCYTPQGAMSDISRPFVEYNIDHSVQKQVNLPETLYTAVTKSSVSTNLFPTKRLRPQSSKDEPVETNWVGQDDINDNSSKLKDESMSIQNIDYSRAPKSSPLTESNSVYTSNSAKLPGFLKSVNDISYNAADISVVARELLKNENFSDESFLLNVKLFLAIMSTKEFSCTSSSYQELPARASQLHVAAIPSLLLKLVKPDNDTPENFDAMEAGDFSKRHKGSDYIKCSPSKAQTLNAKMTYIEELWGCTVSSALPRFVCAAELLSHPSWPAEARIFAFNQADEQSTFIEKCGNIKELSASHDSLPKNLEFESTIPYVIDRLVNMVSLFVHAILSIYSTVSRFGSRSGRSTGSSHLGRRQQAEILKVAREYLLAFFEATEIISMCVASFLQKNGLGCATINSSPCANLFRNENESIRDVFQNSLSAAALLIHLPACVEKDSNMGTCSFSLNLSLPQSLPLAGIKIAHAISAWTPCGDPLREEITSLLLSTLPRNQARAKFLAEYKVKLVGNDCPINPTSAAILSVTQALPIVDRSFCYEAVSSLSTSVSNNISLTETCVTPAAQKRKRGRPKRTNSSFVPPPPPPAAPAITISEIVVRRCQEIASFFVNALINWIMEVVNFSCSLKTTPSGSFSWSNLSRQADQDDVVVQATSPESTRNLRDATETVTTVLGTLVDDLANVLCLPSFPAASMIIQSLAVGLAKNFVYTVPSALPTNISGVLQAISVETIGKIVIKSSLMLQRGIMILSGNNLDAFRRCTSGNAIVRTITQLLVNPAGSCEFLEPSLSFDEEWSVCLQRAQLYAQRINNNTKRYQTLLKAEMQQDPAVLQTNLETSENSLLDELAAVTPKPLSLLQRVHSRLFREGITNGVESDNVFEAALTSLAFTAEGISPNCKEESPALPYKVCDELLRGSVSLPVLSCGNSSTFPTDSCPTRNLNVIVQMIQPFSALHPSNIVLLVNVLLRVFHISSIAIRSTSPVRNGSSLPSDSALNVPQQPTSIVTTENSSPAASERMKRTALAHIHTLFPIIPGILQGPTWAISNNLISPSTPPRLREAAIPLLQLLATFQLNHNYENDANNLSALALSALVHLLNDQSNVVITSVLSHFDLLLCGSTSVTAKRLNEASARYVMMQLLNLISLDETNITSETYGGCTTYRSLTRRKVVWGPVVRIFYMRWFGLNDFGVSDLFNEWAFLLERSFTNTNESGADFDLNQSSSALASTSMSQILYTILELCRQNSSSNNDDVSGLKTTFTKKNLIGFSCTSSVVESRIVESVRHFFIESDVRTAEEIASGMMVIHWIAAADYKLILRASALAYVIRFIDLAGGLQKQQETSVINGYAGALILQRSLLVLCSVLSQIGKEEAEIVFSDRSNAGIDFSRLLSSLVTFLGIYNTPFLQNTIISCAVAVMCCTIEFRNVSTPDDSSLTSGSKGIHEKDLSFVAFYSNKGRIHIPIGNSNSIIKSNLLMCYSFMNRLYLVALTCVQNIREYVERINDLFSDDSCESSDKTVSDIVIQLRAKLAYVVRALQILSNFIAHYRPWTYLTFKSQFSTVLLSALTTSALPNRIAAGEGILKNYYNLLLTLTPLILKITTAMDRNRAQQIFQSNPDICGILRAICSIFNALVISGFSSLCSSAPSVFVPQCTDTIISGLYETSDVHTQRTALEAVFACLRRQEDLINAAALLPSNSTCTDLDSGLSILIAQKAHQPVIELLQFSLVPNIRFIALDIIEHILKGGLLVPVTFASPLLAVAMADVSVQASRAVVLLSDLCEARQDLVGFIIASLGKALRISFEAATLRALSSSTLDKDSLYDLELSLSPFAALYKVLFSGTKQRREAFVSALLSEQLHVCTSGDTGWNNSKSLEANISNNPHYSQFLTASRFISYVVIALLQLPLANANELLLFTLKIIDRNLNIAVSQAPICNNSCKNDVGMNSIDTPYAFLAVCLFKLRELLWNIRELSQKALNNVTDFRSFSIENIMPTLVYLLQGYESKDKMSDKKTDFQQCVNNVFVTVRGDEDAVDDTDDEQDNNKTIMHDTVTKTRGKKRGRKIL